MCHSIFFINAGINTNITQIPLFFLFQYFVGNHFVRFIRNSQEETQKSFPYCPLFHIDFKEKNNCSKTMK